MKNKVLDFLFNQKQTAMAFCFKLQKKGFFMHLKKVWQDIHSRVKEERDKNSERRKDATHGKKKDKII